MGQIKKRKFIYRTTAFLMAVVFLCLMSVTAFATDGGALANSTIAQGTKRLVEDATGYLMILLPIAVGLLCGYFALRTSAVTDESDKKMWSNRIKTALFCLVIGECAGGIVGLAMTYYGGSV